MESFEISWYQWLAASNEELGKFYGN